VIYTPKKASSLNVIEIDFSALSKQCLDCRIGNIDELKKEVATWTNKRIKDQVKINWQFSKEKAKKNIKVSEIY
jgi:hypothetical protein